MLRMFFLLCCMLCASLFAKAQFINPAFITTLGQASGNATRATMTVKQSRTIKKSLTLAKIDSVEISMLRMDYNKIVSNAKRYIIIVEEQLQELYNNYNARKHVNTADCKKNTMRLNNIDPAWPVNYYEKEIAAYDKYEEKLISDSSLMAKKGDSTIIVSFRN